MKSPIGWGWPLVTVAGVVIALAGGSALAVVVLGATLAIFGAGMTCVGVFRWDPLPELTATGDSLPPRLGVRELFLEGAAGREQILIRLERLEEQTLLARPTPMTAGAWDALLRSPDSTFCEHVARRMERIEGNR